MADDNVIAKVHSLSDTELACLLSLINSEHCMISTPADSLDDLTAELQLITDQTFGLESAVVDCTPHTTLDDFASSLLIHAHPTSPTATRSRYPGRPGPGGGPGGGTHGASDSYFPPGHVAFTPARPRQQASISPMTPGPDPASASAPGTSSQMANVVLAKNLDRAPRAVQIQALELLRTKRIFTRTSVQTAPKTFMLVAVLAADSGGAARVTAHLNDFFYVAHWVDPEEEGFARLDGDDDESFVSSSEGRGGGGGDDGASIASTLSVVKRRGRSRVQGGGGGGGGAPADMPLFRSPKYLGAADRDGSSSNDNKPPTFSPSDISHLRQLSERTAVDIDVTRYQMNIVSFLRMHRAVGGGISPQATRHFEQLMRSLAPLHGLDYVTPGLAQLAARKVYLHRIKMAEPARERSMQWGSEIKAIEMLLDGWGPEDVIEEVLELVAAPV